jgi:hypothetical protein
MIAKDQNMKKNVITYAHGLGIPPLGNINSHVTIHSSASQY